MTYDDASSTRHRLVPRRDVDVDAMSMSFHFRWKAKESTVCWKSGMTVDDDPFLPLFDGSGILPLLHEATHDPKQQQQQQPPPK